MNTRPLRGPVAEDERNEDVYPELRRLACSPCYAIMMFRVAAPARWTTDTDQSVLHAHDGADARTLGLPFVVERGYAIFQMQIEDLECSCWIAARSLRMTQMRRPDEPLQLPEGWSGGGGWLPRK